MTVVEKLQLVIQAPTVEKAVFLPNIHFLFL